MSLNLIKSFIVENIYTHIIAFYSAVSVQCFKAPSRSNVNKVYLDIIYCVGGTYLVLSHEYIFIAYFITTKVDYHSNCVDCFITLEILCH